MKYQGRDDAEWGFKNPVEGWHEVVITSEVEITTSQASGKSSLKIPTQVVEGEFAKANITIFAPMDSDFGEQKVADVVRAVGLESKLNEAFPGDVSFFDAAVIKRLQQALPGKYLSLQLEPYTAKDGKTYGNIVKIGKSGGGHAAEAKPQKAKSAAPADEAW